MLAQFGSISVYLPNLEEVCPMGPMAVTAPPCGKGLQKSNGQYEHVYYYRANGVIVMLRLIICSGLVIDEVDLRTRVPFSPIAKAAPSFAINVGGIKLIVNGRSNSNCQVKMPVMM